MEIAIGKRDTICCKKGICILEIFCIWADQFHLHRQILKAGFNRIKIDI